MTTKESREILLRDLGQYSPATWMVVQEIIDECAAYRRVLKTIAYSRHGEAIKVTLARDVLTKFGGK